MYCENCGKKIEDDSSVCPFCGVLVDNGAVGGNGNKYANIFVDPDENYIDSLGDEYLSSFFTSQKIRRCVALLTDKRVYLRGNTVDINNGKIARINMQKTIDLEDITGTGFIFASSQLWKLILAILTAPLIVPAILLLVSYFKNRDTLFFIEYAGGCIKFNASIYGLVESQDFEKQIRRAKNRLKEG